MIRYNDINRNALDLASKIIEVQKKYNFSECPVDVQDEKRIELINRSVLPAYCAPSKVDKTFFRPGLNDLAQIDSSLRKPIYDSSPDGSMPDYGVNIAYIRSVARDKVDIDMALDVVKRTIEASKLEDADKLAALKSSEENLNKLKETIIAAKTENESTQADSK